jgi:hypothetical protein
MADMTETLPTQGGCSEWFRNANDQLNQHSPEERADLTSSEHLVAEKLAAEARNLLKPKAQDENLSNYLDRHNQIYAEMKELLAPTEDKSRMDGILADAK